MKKDIQVVICPTLREPNGLAMSSRNLRLSSEEKKLASELHASLEEIKKNLSGTNFNELKKKAISHLENIGFTIEYLELARRNDLEVVSESDDQEGFIILIAAFLNHVRLIDNLPINGNI